jgi:hypothetical protein
MRIFNDLLAAVTWSYALALSLYFGVRFTVPALDPWVELIGDFFPGKSSGC